MDLSERETKISRIQQQLETANDELQKKMQELYNLVRRVTVPNFEGMELNKADKVPCDRVDILILKNNI